MIWQQNLKRKDLRKLSKEFLKLRFPQCLMCLEDNNKLVELYEQAAAESNNKRTADPHSAQNDTEIHNNAGIELNKEKEVEMNKVIKNLEHQLMEMHEENEKLMSLYVRAMQEKDELKRVLSCGGEQSLETKREFDCAEKVVEVDGEGNTSESPVSQARGLLDQTNHHGLNTQDALITDDINMCTKKTDDSRLNVYDYLMTLIQ